MTPERVVVVIPTYDEVQNLESAVRAVLAAAPVHVLVVDDRSPDGTGELADRLASAEPRLRVLHRAGREGLGAAYLAGFAEVLAREPRVEAIVEMDADGSHPADALPALLAALEGTVGLAIGSRWVPGGSVIGWPRYRQLISRAGNAYARLMLRLQVRDATAGYRAFRREALEAAIATPVASRGYCFQIDLARRVVDAGYAVAEQPIAFKERIHGRSKMNGRIVLEAMLRVTRWGVELRLGRGAPRGSGQGKVRRNTTTDDGIPRGFHQARSDSSEP